MLSADIYAGGKHDFFACLKYLVLIVASVC